MKPKYFVDTTILAEVLLKHGARVDKIRGVLADADTELPAFAIRELKAGPLRYFVWVHNKLVQTKSLAAVLRAIQGMSRTPQRYLTSTAIEALTHAQERGIGTKTLGALTKKYGRAANPDIAHADELRLHLRRVIAQAWKQRRSVTNSVVRTLSCYQETAPVENRGLLEVTPNKCFPSPECCLASELKAAIPLIKKLREANQKMPVTRETQRRGKVLKELSRKSNYICKRLSNRVVALSRP